MTPEDVVTSIDPQEVVDLALALGNIDSPTGSEGPAGEFVYDWLAAQGFAPKRYRDGRGPDQRRRLASRHRRRLQPRVQQPTSTRPCDRTPPGQQGSRATRCTTRPGSKAKDLRRRGSQRQGPDGRVPRRGQGDQATPATRCRATSSSARSRARSAVNQSRNGKGPRTCRKDLGARFMATHGVSATSCWSPRAPGSASSASSPARRTSRSRWSRTRRATTRRICPARPDDRRA